MILPATVPYILACTSNILSKSGHNVQELQVLGRQFSNACTWFIFATRASFLDGTDSMMRFMISEHIDYIDDGKISPTARV